MLKQRVITALLLVAVLLPALFSSDPLWLSILASVLVSLAFWEWCRMLGATEKIARTSAVLVLGLTLGVGHGLFMASPVEDRMMAALSLGWAFCFAGMMGGGLLFWQRVPAAARWVWGALALWGTWLALFQAKVVGINFLLSVLCLVWAADVGAYFAGRAFGRHKLAPSLSPGKTWEGVAGATVAVMVLGWIWRNLDQSVSLGSASFFTQTWLRWDVVSLFLWMLMLAFSILGDLFESMVKRVAGVKDSSALLPGHGGVLDRIDALLPTLPLSLWLLTW